MSLADRRSNLAVSAKWMLAAPQNYGFALAAVLAAGILRHLMEVHLGLTHPFILFYAVILVASLGSSLGVAAFSTVVSALMAEYFFLAPLHSFVIANVHDIVGLVMFAIVGFTISIIGDQFRRRTQRLQEFEKAIEGAEEMIFVLDRDYRYQIANRMFLSYLGRKPEAVLGRRAPEVLGEDEFEKRFKGKLDQAFTGKIVQFEMQRTYPASRRADHLS